MKSNKPHTLPTVTYPSSNFPDLQTHSQLSCGDDLWQGTFEAHNSESQFSSPPVSIAIALCEHSLSWLDQLIQGLDSRNITIYSKCGNQVRNISTRTRVVKLKNVGRVDHAYAYHLANLPEETDPDEVQLFLKDTYPAFHQIQLRRRSLQEVVHEAAGTTGFSCGSSPNWCNAFDTTSFPSKTWLVSYPLNLWLEVVCVALVK